LGRRCLGQSGEFLSPWISQSNFPSDAVRVFETRLFRQYFGLERFRQNHKFKALVLEQEPIARKFSSGILSQLLDNLPKVNPGGLIPERNLQANSFRRFDDSFDLGVNQPAA